MEPARIEDTIALQQLLHRYAWASDGRDFPALRECFTPDAVMVLRKLDGSEEAIEGAPAIADWVERRHRAEFARGLRRRHMTTCFLLHACDGVQAFSTAYFCLMEAGDGEPVRIASMGHYEDSFRQTAAGWRFQRRLIVLEGRGAEARPAAMP